MPPGGRHIAVSSYGTWLFAFPPGVVTSKVCTTRDTASLLKTGKVVCSALSSRHTNEQGYTKSINLRIVAESPTLSVSRVLLLHQSTCGHVTLSIWCTNTFESMRHYIEKSTFITYVSVSPSPSLSLPPPPRPVALSLTLGHHVTTSPGAMSRGTDSGFP